MGRGTEQGLHFRLIGLALAVQGFAQPGCYLVGGLLHLAQFRAQLQAFGRHQANLVAVLAMRADEVLPLARGAHFRLRLQGKRAVTVVANELFHAPSVAPTGAKINA